MAKSPNAVLIPLPRREVRGLLERPDDFLPGPLPLRRDGPDDLAPGFTVRDRNYLSARWPGDANAFAEAFAALMEERAAR